MRGWRPGLYLGSGLLCTLALATACGGSGSRDEASARTYTVRGMVRDLPRADRPASEFSVRHEAIDDFVSSQGEMVGMGSMTMPFPVAGAVDLEELAIGDPVELTLMVDWDGDPPVQVTRLRKLPEGTQLEFRPARPRAGSE